jgi:hypothetical protein
MKKSFIMMWGVNELLPDKFIYNWYAASNANLPPTGWKVLNSSNYNDYEDLFNFYTYPQLWNNYGEKFRASDGNVGEFNADNFKVWGSDESVNDPVKGRFAWWFLSVLYYRDAADASFKTVGYPVILIKDDSTDPGTLTDFDGNIYNTIKIGSFVFTTTEFKCQHLNNGTAIPYVLDNTTWANTTSAAMCGINNQAQVPA